MMTPARKALGRQLQDGALGRQVAYQESAQVTGRRYGLNLYRPATWVCLAMTVALLASCRSPSAPAGRDTLLARSAYLRLRVGDSSVLHLLYERNRSIEEFPPETWQWNDAAPRWNSAAPDIVSVSESLAVAVLPGYTRVSVSRDAHRAQVDIESVGSDVPGKYLAVSTSVSSACAVTGDGGAACWGGNGRTQLGTDRIHHMAGSYVPLRIDVGESFVAITMGWEHVCGLSLSGDVWCWGSNDFGQSDPGSNQSSSRPTIVNLPGPASKLAAGGDHTCATLASDSTVYCWGRNNWGQAGANPSPQLDHPTRLVLERVVAIDAGAMHSCAIGKSGIAYCWGSNEFGQLGPAASLRSATPVPIPDHRFTTISSGTGHSCGLSVPNEVVCWGRNLHGERGALVGAWHAVPITGDSVKAIEAGHDRSCAIGIGGELWCWGNNEFGKLGVSPQANAQLLTPTRIPFEGRYVTVTLSGFAHSCGTLTAGGAACWGSDHLGQAGTGRRRVGIRYSHVPSIVTDVWRR